jgi:hypothetical protein
MLRRAGERKDERDTPRKNGKIKERIESACWGGGTRMVRLARSCIRVRVLKRETRLAALVSLSMIPMDLFVPLTGADYVERFEETTFCGQMVHRGRVNRLTDRRRTPPRA